MLTALEALMDGCHRVGRLLPEVQKCRLKRQKKADATQISWSFQKQFNRHQVNLFLTSPHMVLNLLVELLFTLLLCRHRVLQLLKTPYRRSVVCNANSWDVCFYLVCG